MNWIQNYDPMGNFMISTLVSLIPIIFFFWALGIKKMKGYAAGISTAIIAIAISIVSFKMPADKAVLATLFGGLSGLWPIGWIVVNAVFLYKITVKTGQIDIIRSSITSLTEDRRLQLLLIAISFSGFMEGAAGFGTPVAISAALLVGLGFDPLKAAGLCMIANTAPVAFGAIGIPIITAGQVSGIPAADIGSIAGLHLGILSLIVPFWVIFAMVGFKRTIEVVPAILVTGLSFGVTMWATAIFLGPELPAITGSLVSLLALAIFLKVWKPKSIYRFNGEIDETNSKTKKVDTKNSYTIGQMVRAWSPFIILTVLITIWGIPEIKQLLRTTNIPFPIPGLDQLVMRASPIVPELTPYNAVYTFDWLAAAGTAILIAAFISKFLVNMKFTDWVSTYVENLKELTPSLITIVSVLGYAYIANYSGMSAILGLAAASTGKLFPLFAPVLGWVGVFLTGSNTSSSALFGNLQRITAEQIGMNPTLAVAANAIGGSTGKMISPQSLAVGAGATGLSGRESEILRFTLKHSIGMLLLTSIMIYIMTYI